MPDNKSLPASNAINTQNFQVDALARPVAAAAGAGAAATLQPVSAAGGGFFGNAPGFVPVSEQKLTGIQQFAARLDGNKPLSFKVPVAADNKIETFAEINTRFKNAKAKGDIKSIRELAVDKQHGQAQIYLSICYETGMGGMKQDLSKALGFAEPAEKILQLNSKKYTPKELFDLANRYFVEQEFELAYLVYQHVTDYPKALLGLLCCQVKLNVPKQYILKTMRLLVNQPDPLTFATETDIALIATEKTLLPEIDEKSKLAMLITANNFRGILALAIHYKNVATDYKKDMKFDNATNKFAEALATILHTKDSDDPVCLYEIGRFYRDGIGCKPNLIQAKHYFSKAAAFNYQLAKEDLDQLNTPSFVAGAANLPTFFDDGARLIPDKKEVQAAAAANLMPRGTQEIDDIAIVMTASAKEYEEQQVRAAMAASVTARVRGAGGIRIGLFDHLAAHPDQDEYPELALAIVRSMQS